LPIFYIVLRPHGQKIEFLQMEKSHKQATYFAGSLIFSNSEIDVYTGKQKLKL